jgi:hypothetical protein
MYVKVACTHMHGDPATPPEPPDREEMSTMDVELFDYSPIIDREPIEWPGGARVAFYVGLNVEHFYVDLPSTSINDATAGLVPDALNYG